jgi:hypothetical protein
MSVNITEKEGKKYIDGEEVLYEYDCWTNWIVVRTVLSLFALYVIYQQGFIKHQEYFAATFAFVLIFAVMMSWFFVDIKTIINRGVYITKNNIITFSGKKIALDDVYYKWGAGGAGGDRGSTSFELYDQKKLLLSCIVKEDDEKYNQMIDALQKVSDNKNLRTISKRDGKRKLIQKGEDDGRASCV